MSKQEDAKLASALSGLTVQSTPPSPTAPSPWDEIVDLCRSKLDPEDFEEVVNLGSLEGLLQYGSDLQQRHAESRPHELNRLRGFLLQLRSFNSVFDVLVHIKPTTIAPLWGSMRFCLELINETDEVFQLIVEMLEEIRTNLPQVEVYMENIDDHESLRQLCCEEILLIAEFACQVIVYYRRNPFKNLLGVTWKPFRDDFTKLMGRIRNTTRRIELEAQSLSMKQNTRKHEELKKLLEAKQGDAQIQLPCFHVPYPRNPNFEGRTEVLDDIAKHFEKSNDELRIYALHGLGAVGKTQTALEFAYRSSEAQAYDAIFWISADLRPDQDIVDALTKLGRIKEDHKFNAQQCRSHLLNWLQGTDKSWLIVFDNADDLKGLQNLFPVAKHGSIILTSRDPGAARYPSSGPATKGHPLLPLPSEPGKRLLLKLLKVEASGVENEEKLAEELVETLGGLPLAINQMANYMLDTGCSLEDFVEIFSNAEDRAEVMKVEPETPNLAYSHSLQTVWQISLKRIQEVNKDASRLLEIMAFFDPDGIPDTLLCSRTVDKASKAEFPQLDFLSNGVKLLNATKPLLQQSLVTKDQISAPPPSHPQPRSQTHKVAQPKYKITMHRLVSSMTINNLDDDGRQERFDEALELIYRIYPRLSATRASLSDVWSTCRLYLPHVLALERAYRQSNGEIEPRAKFATVLANASWFLFEQSLPGQAMEILPTALEVGEATQEGNEHAVSTIYRTYGAIYLDANRNQEAFTNFQNQLRVLSSAYGPDDIAASHGYNNVALGYAALGKFDEAAQNYQKAMDIRSKDPQAAKGYQAMTLINLGVLEGLQKNYEKAFSMLNEGIGMYNELLGDGNYLTASAYFYIGNFHVDQGEFEKGFDAHSRCLTLRREAIGDTYRTAAAFYKIAWHKHHDGDDEAAEIMLLNALRIYTNWDESRGSSGRAYYLMSQVLSSLGREEDARNAKAQAAKVRKELLGIDPGDDDNLESYDKLVGFLDR